MHPEPEFVDRTEAGRRLAQALSQRNLSRPLVLALPRGGVAVAAEVARRLTAPLDVLLVRKIPTPGEPELALGAVAEGEPPTVVLNQDVLTLEAPSQRYLEQAVQAQLAEIARRRGVYRGGAAAPEVRGRTVVLVDDGLATGATARAAGLALRAAGAARTILAVPVAPASALEALANDFDEIVCLRAPRSFRGVGGCYQEFHQLADAEVVNLLKATNGQSPTGPPG